MAYDRSHLIKFIEEKSLKVLHVQHDDFSLHETYVVATDGVKFYSLITIGDEKEIHVVEFDTALSAFTYVTTTAFATFLHLTEHEDDNIDCLALSQRLREVALSRLKCNAEYQHKHGRSYDKGEHYAYLV